jgi:hypothetical protein
MSMRGQDGFLHRDRLGAQAFKNKPELMKVRLRCEVIFVLLSKKRRESACTIWFMRFVASEIVDLFEDMIGSLLGILGSDLLNGRLLLLFFLRTVNRDHPRENQSWNKK